VLKVLKDLRVIHLLVIRVDRDLVVQQVLRVMWDLMLLVMSEIQLKVREVHKEPREPKDQKVSKVVLGFHRQALQDQKVQ
jgi:hypothetical protein